MQFVAFDLRLLDDDGFNKSASTNCFRNVYLGLESNDFKDSGESGANQGRDRLSDIWSCYLPAG